MSVNKVLLIGHAGKDPDLRYLPDGSAVATVSVATSHKWKDKATGDTREEVEWSRVSFFGKLAEIVGKYVQKGSQIYVEGRLRTRKYKDKDGVEKYSTEIVADQMQLLGGRERREEAPARGKPAGSVAGMEDDLPFAPIDRRALYVI